MPPLLPQLISRRGRTPKFTFQPLVHYLRGLWEQEIGREDVENPTQAPLAHFVSVFSLILGLVSCHGIILHKFATFSRIVSAEAVHRKGLGLALW